jgi:hypothetical protein
MVYALGTRGAQLLKVQDGFENAGLDWATKNRRTGREFILHTLAIADLRVALTIACRRHPGYSILEPEQLLLAAPAETQGARSPWSWRVQVQHQGVVHEIGVVPDFVFGLVLPDGRRRPFVVEVDRGTMPVERATLDRSSVLRKFLAYEGGRKQGLHTSRFGWKDFRVLVATSNERRAENMRQLVSRNTALSNSPLFLFARQETLLETDVLEQPWTAASGQHQRLG